jgi:hypothetical protein
LLSLEPPLQWLLEQDGCWQHVSTPGGSAQGWTKVEMLRSYRDWAKTAQVRGATDFTGAEIFWASIKRLLNDKIFPGRQLFRTSGGGRFVLLPPRQEMLEGFNRLLGGKVVDVDEEYSVPRATLQNTEDVGVSPERGAAQEMDVKAVAAELGAGNKALTSALEASLPQAQADLAFVRRNT